VVFEAGRAAVEAGWLRASFIPVWFVSLSPF
jgi:hypothetical protein